MGSSTRVTHLHRPGRAHGARADRPRVRRRRGAPLHAAPRPRRPCCRRASRPLRVLHISDLHLTPRHRGRVEWVRSPRRARPRPRRGHRRLPLAPGGRAGRRRGARAAARRGRACSCSARTTTTRPRSIQPWRYLSRPVRARRAPRAAAVGRPGEVAERGGLARPVQRARRRSTVDGRAIDVRGVDDPHILRDRYDEVAGPFAAEADLALGVTHAPYLPRARRDGGRRRRPRARRPHPRRPAVHPRVRRARHQLRPRAAAARRASPGTRGPGTAPATPGSAAPTAAGRSCTSPPGWAPRRTPRCGSPARPRRPCSPSRPTPDRETWAQRRPRAPASTHLGFWTAAGTRFGRGRRRTVDSPSLHRGVAQLGSALRSGRRGRRFKSCHPDFTGERPCRTAGPLACEVGVRRFGRNSTRRPGVPRAAGAPHAAARPT